MHKVYFNKILISQTLNFSKLPPITRTKRRFPSLVKHNNFTLNFSKKISFPLGFIKPVFHCITKYNGWRQHLARGILLHSYYQPRFDGPLLPVLWRRGRRNWQRSNDIIIIQQSLKFLKISALKCKVKTVAEKWSFILRIWPVNLLIDNLRDSQLVIFSLSTILITFPTKVLQVFSSNAFEIPAFDRCEVRVTVGKCLNYHF